MRSDALAHAQRDHEVPPGDLGEAEALRDRF